MTGEKEIKHLLMEINQTDAKDFEKLGELVIKLKKTKVGNEPYAKLLTNKMGMIFRGMTDEITDKIKLVILDGEDRENEIKIFLKSCTNKEKERFIKVRNNVQKVFEKAENDKTNQTRKNR